MAQKEVILGVTASIASYKACDIIRALKEANYKVTVVMTHGAKEFITPLSLAVLSQNKVYSGMFIEPHNWDIEHISLADKADVVLIAPATANVISRLAAGICDDLLSCTVMAAKAPVLIAPAMNCNMYEHPLTQENIAKLKKIGYTFIGPQKGKLATGKVGIGHLADVEDMVREVKRILK